MNTYDFIMQRRSVRNFEDKDIPENIVDKLLDSIINAPTGGNIQPVSVILVKESERRRELAQIVGNQPWVAKAPLSMIFCIDFLRIKKWAELSDTEFKGEKALSPFLIAFADIMCAAQNVVILAETLGLGSVYIGTILTGIERARDYFLIPDYVLPVMVLSLGYPKSKPTTIPKLKKEDLIHREIYKEPVDLEIKKAFEDKYGSFEDNLEKYFKRAFIEANEADDNYETNWREKLEETIKKLEIKNNAQFLFNLRYPGDMMIKLNENITNALKNAGFDFIDYCKSK